MTPPTVSSMVVTPVSVDVRDGTSKTFAATLDAGDDLSGVSYASATYRRGSTNAFISFSFGSYNRTAGTEFAGTYSNSVSVTPDTANGTYTLSSLTIQDRVGNYRTYLPSHGVATASLEVLSNADDVAPVIVSVTADPTVLDVSTGIKATTVEVQATDDRSGVRYVIGTFRSPSGRQGATFAAYPVAGEPGVARGRTTVSRYSEAGEWKLDFLCAIDYAGNQACFNESGTPKLSTVFPLALTVISDPADGVKPQVSAFRLSPTAIDVTNSDASVKTDFDVSDALSGVQSAYIRFRSPRTVGASPETIDRYGFASPPSIFSYAYQPDGSYLVTEDDSKRLLAGTISASTTFPRYDRSGNWAVLEVCVIDNVNWRTCYTASSTPPLSGIGPTGVVVEWNRTPSVSVTGITQATYAPGSEPTPGCAVNDLEDGVQTGVSPVVTGPDADGFVTVTCSYTDTGGITGSAVKSYQIVAPENNAPVVAVTGITQASYTAGSEPTVGCDVSDAEDGVISTVNPLVSGPNASGIVTVTCSYVDTGGKSGSDQKTYQVTAPLNTAPSVSVTGVTGTTYEVGLVPAAGCAVVDAEDTGESATPTLGPVSGPLAAHGLGTVEVTCSYTDGGGLSASASVTYTIADTKGPTLNLAPVSVPATSASGAAVTYTATATDNGSAAPNIVCTPPSGSSFPIGTSTVSCTATDVAGNSTTGSFTVTVRPTCTITGIGQPVNADGSSVFKIGSVVPVKLIAAATNCFGVNPEAVTPQIALRRLDTVPDGAVNEVLSPGSGDAGAMMKYIGGQFAYNLSTKKSQFCGPSGTAYCASGDLTPGTYEATITAPEFATPIVLRFNLRR